ncbi:MAG TPA: RusA family crossover junction endodeoxyribonuclease [Phycisphaerae bacterium]|nr:RusA family crossover junction endodeoxyribonuclease [Phycisphaerae bacterium]
MLTVALPYPPSVNHYWRRVGPRTVISRQGRAYRRDVATAVRLIDHAAERLPLTGPLSVEVVLYPPDRRRRDLDNALKAIFDALEHAGVYPDDSLIEQLSVEKRDVVAGGKAVVIIQRRCTLPKKTEAKA